LKNKTILFPIISIGLLLLSGCITTPTRKVNLTGAAISNTNLGLDYLQKGEVLRGKQKIMTSLREAPRLPASWYTMGYLMEATGHTQAAEKYYLKAIKLAPHSGMTRNNYGTYLCRSGRYTEAVQQFLKAVQQPYYLDVASAYENAGLCAMLIPNDIAAKNYFLLALQNNPSKPTSMLELSNILHREKKYRQAAMYLRSYNKMVKKLGKSKKYLLTRREIDRSALPMPGQRRDDR